MSRVPQQQDRTFVYIKNNEKWQPKFYIGDQVMASVSGKLVSIDTEKRKITPTKWTNAGTEVTIRNLLVWLEDDEGLMEVQISLYSGLARTVLNTLAWPEPLGEIHLSVYKNNKGYKNISIKKSTKDQDWYKALYDWETEMGMIETKVEKGEEVKDYDKLTDKYIAELIPIINDKIENSIVDAPQEEEEEDVMFDTPPETNTAKSKKKIE